MWLYRVVTIPVSAALPPLAFGLAGLGFVARRWKRGISYSPYSWSRRSPEAIPAELKSKNYRAPQITRRRDLSERPKSLVAEGTIPGRRSRDRLARS